VTFRWSGGAVAALSTAVAFGACTAGGTPNPQPSIMCLIAQPFLLQAFPISGSTGVPVATASFVFGIPQGSTASAYGLQLFANGQTHAGSALGAPPSPLPSPIATLPANYVYAGASPPALQSSTTYTVQLTQPITCLGPATTGTFSTQ
jgi:hypothetical protein